MNPNHLLLLIRSNADYSRRPAGVRICGVCAVHSQRGIALAMSLLFLLLLTLIGITSMNTGILQERMAGNMRDLDIALQASESSMRYGETLLSQIPTQALCDFPPPQCGGPDANGMWCTGGVDYDNSSWWSTWGMLLENDSVQQVAEASEDPRHVIEYLNRVPDSAQMEQDQYGSSGSIFYRISARGVGRTPSAQVILRNTHKVKCN